MKYSFIIITLACTLFLSGYCFAQTISTPPQLEVTINSEGRGTVSLTIPREQTTPLIPSLLSTGYATTFVMVPFEYKNSWTIQSAPDVRVGILSYGPGYTLIYLLYTSGQKPIIVSLEGIISLEETADNTKIEFDYSYPFLSDSDRAIVQLPQTFSLWNTKFMLPKEYSKYRVNTHPKAMAQIDARNYNLSLAAVKAKPGRVWIVFPDPQKASLSKAMIILGLLFGIFTALFQILPLRERKIIVLLAIFGLSAIFASIAVYLLFTLPKRLDLGVWIAVSLPHVLLSGISCLYLIVARKLQATVVGSISLNGKSTNFATVRLIKFENGNKKIVATKDRINAGEFEFHVWVRKTSKFQILAKSKLAEPVESSKFDLNAKDTHPVGELKLSTPIVVQDAELDDATNQ
ncbi:hypothetical protein KA005_05365 [bacterium]|nr:hypothetical protein [bacterium]